MEYPKTYRFQDVAMIPQEGDSAAVAKCLLVKGTVLTMKGNRIVTLKAPCLEGHRFAVKSVALGAPLLSWGLPFGHALADISPGHVLLNQKAAAALGGRLHGPHQEVTAIQELLQQSAPVNFEDLDVSPDHPFRIEEHGFHAVGMNEPKLVEGTFFGYRRPNGRGVGTRNHVAVIALTASASPFIAPFRTRWRQFETNVENFDGVRIVAHTEGESSGEQRNIIHIHRCLAGFLSHMNVGAAVVVTTGLERHVTRDTLLQFVAESNASGDKPPVYPPQSFEAPFCQFVQVHGAGQEDSLEKLDQAVRDAVAHATDGVKREPCPLSDLCIALQCGGSDSFSGLTGNPLVGDVAARFISDHASSAILAESPELVGAEPYVLSRVASEAVAKDFIRTTENYKAYGARHGLSVAGNPSGGNLYRGLYNIVLKSLGAARKKPPTIALDVVLKYGEPMQSHRETSHGPPYYAFMDSPGNDLESIAGQVASGANLVIFITGNGAMTNFPFVPTVKVVTTSKRYEMLKHEMDINGEPYGHGGQDRIKAVNDGFDLCVSIASGERSKGEAAGHSQVSFWRNWAVGQNDELDKESTHHIPGASKPSVDELLLCTREDPHQVRPDPPPFPPSLLQTKPIVRVQEESSSSTATCLRPCLSGASLALIPTSLCSSAVAASMKDHIEEQYGDTVNIVCPSHTEGCGAAGDSIYERRYQRLMLGHALHPSVGRAIFLEHGCEKTHNDYFMNCLQESGVLGVDDDVDSYFGFWSLQGGGGYDNAKKKVIEYLCGSQPPEKCDGSLFGIPWSDRPIAVGLIVDPSIASASEVSPVASELGSIVRFLSQLQIHTVLPANSPLISRPQVGENGKANQSASAPAKPPTAAGDMEDFFAPTALKTRVLPSKKKTKAFSDLPISSQFAVEALVDATIPDPTLLSGQMVGQSVQKTAGGLHVMEIPEGASWDETVSCLGPACDVMLLVAGANEISLLPSSCLTPTLRRATPSFSDDSQVWHQWTLATCTELVRVLHSPLVSGAEKMDPKEVASLQKSLFSMTTFVVPRGPTAVSF